ncbi:invasion associated locus B family protein [Hansschlegelia sp. KR7-227]|uniref:invasion associated locus B family protein n=1 Tax=Hansschlegelia sp. KR7-227 TaxID=3400914 RepID=UPI003C0FC019
MFRNVIAALSLVFFVTPASGAANPQKIGTFKDWTVWKYTQTSRKRCFIYSNPTRSEPRRLDHGLVSFFVRSTVRKDVASEASLQVGYPLAPGSEAVLDVDGGKFRLATSGKGAWLVKPERERELLDALRKGSTLTVSARSARGNRTTYAFSLAGVTDAMGRLRQACP